jgi:SAM-dependent methyltransferase
MRGLRRGVARQLGHPSGGFGRLLARGLNRFNRDINAEAIAALEVDGPDHAVDVGFGGGVGLSGLLDGPARLVTGIDRAPDMVAAAAKRFSREVSSGRLALAEGSVAELPLADGEVDRLLTVHTLYFWPDAEAGMAELHRVTARDGRVCVAIQPREAMEDDPLHERGFRLYSAADLRRLLESAGFTAVEVREGEGRLLGLARR